MGTAQVALTHQSLAADNALAADGCVDLVLGGHEHEVFLEGTDACKVVKAGMDATRAAIVDLDVASGAASVEIRDVAAALPAPDVFAACLDQFAFLKSLDDEKVVEARDATRCLSSKRARFRQTSVGELLCTAVRDWFRCDACVINGGTIKGGKTYDAAALSFLDLKKELPFPTKMVVADMPGAGRPPNVKMHFLSALPGRDPDAAAASPLSTEYPRGTPRWNRRSPRNIRVAPRGGAATRPFENHRARCALEGVRPDRMVAHRAGQARSSRRPSSTAAAASRTRSGAGSCRSATQWTSTSQTASCESMAKR